MNEKPINDQEMLQNKKVAAAAESIQLCPTQCDPIDSSPPDSSVSGILQAGILEWVAISVSKMVAQTSNY